MTSSDEGEPVQLYIYDLSRGLAKQFAPLVALQVNTRSGSIFLGCVHSADRLPPAAWPRCWICNVVFSPRAAAQLQSIVVMSSCGVTSRSLLLCCLACSALVFGHVPPPSDAHGSRIKPCACHTQLDGIWHTSIVVGGQEIYYGGGIQTAVPGTTPHGQPVQVGHSQLLARQFPCLEPSQQVGLQPAVCASGCCFGHVDVIWSGVCRWMAVKAWVVRPACAHACMHRGVQIVELGRTEVPAELRQEFLLDLSDRYTPEKYSLLHNNCNNFRRAPSHLVCTMTLRCLSSKCMGGDCVWGVLDANYHDSVDGLAHWMPLVTTASTG